MKTVLIVLNRWTEKLEMTVVIAGVLLMMVNSVVNATGRYLFNHSFFFAEELNQFLIVFVTFVGFAYAVRKGRNIRMTAVYDTLNFKVKKFLVTFISLLTALLMGYLAYLAVLYVVEIKDLNRLSSALQLPVYVVYCIIPVGFFMAALQYTCAFLMNISHREIYLSFDTVESDTEQVVL